MSDIAHDPDVEGLLTSEQVRARFGNISEVTLGRWLRDARVAFPRPDVVVHYRRFWRPETIRAFELRSAPPRGGEAA